MTLWRPLYAIAVFQAITSATPVVTYPINSQVPPVARLSEPFLYTFSTSTFSSNLPITYTLSNAPSWLSLDGNTRTLSGTPTRNDVGDDAVTAFGVELTASDSSGSVTVNSTFVISKNPAPVASIPLSSQLPYMGRFSAPSTLLLHQSSPFRFSFQPGTFSERGSNTALSYYATSIANTPLPSWLIFDAASLSLTGHAPDYTALIGIQLIASDVEGFSGASMSFHLAIGIHTLAFTRQPMVINAIPGTDVNFNGLSSNLELDGQPTGLSSLASITAQTPPWLSFDNSTLTISGHTPADATPCNITVHATDIYGDSASATIAVGIGPMKMPSPFTSTTSPVSVGSALDTSRKHFSKRVIAAIIVPTVLLFLTVLAAILWCRLRRRTSSQHNRTPFITDKCRFSESSNAEESSGSPPVVPPKCLRLEALKCVDPGWTSPYMTEYTGERRVARGKTSTEQSVEGSFVSTALVPEPLDLAGCGNRSRAGAENTLHRSKLSWGSTLTSIFPTVRSRTNSSCRQTSNYSPCSERGHTKRSGRMWSPDQDFRGIHSFRQRATESRDSNISFGAVINFPILSEITVDQEKAGSKFAENNSTLKLIRRRSKSLPTIPPLYSSGAFRRPVSMLALAGGIHDERYAKEGHDWVDSQGVTRKSSSWVTVHTKEEKSLRSSSLNLSARAESFYHGGISQRPASLLYDNFVPSASYIPETNLVERKSIKRCISSSFFGAPSSKRLRQLSKQSTATSADAVFNPGLEIPIDPSDIAFLNGSERNSRVPQYSSLSSAREGTRQLKDYIQSFLRRTWTQDGVPSNDPSDSLFESARDSLSSMEEFPGVRDSRGSEVKRRLDEQRHGSLLSESASEWSWETHYTEQDDKETVIEDGTNNSPTTEFGTVAAGSSDLGSPVRGVVSKDARMYTGSGRRLDGNRISFKSMQKPSRALLDYGEGGLDDITYI